MSFRQSSASDFLMMASPQEKRILGEFIGQVAALEDRARSESPPNSLSGTGKPESHGRADSATSKLANSYGHAAFGCLPEELVDADRDKKGDAPPLIYTVISMPTAEKICGTGNLEKVCDLLKLHSAYLQGNLARAFVTIGHAPVQALEMYDLIRNQEMNDPKNPLVPDGVRAIWVINVVYWDAGPKNSDQWIQVVALGDSAGDVAELMPNYEEDPSRFKSTIKKLAPNVYACYKASGNWSELVSLLNTPMVPSSYHALLVLEEMHSPDKQRNFVDAYHVMSERANKSMRCCAQCSKAGFKLKCCGGCKKVYYCSPECQKVHWRADHRKACKKN